jgi:hypothetical protein
MEKTADETALQVRMKGSERLFLIAGRKIITKEDLEVLALCTLEDFPDHESLRDTVKRIDQSGAVPVVPWAVGKWMGRRGRVLDELIDRPEGTFFFLCDNGNRPYFWRWPSHLKKGEKNGVPVISGSDPLHFAKESDRIGRCGFLVDGDLSSEDPASELTRILRQPSGSYVRYGKRETLTRFIRNQVLMQLFKKKWRKALLK